VLTADLVTARRRGDELRLAPTDDVRRGRIATLAAALTARAREEVGNLRDDVEEALRQTATALEEGGDRRLGAAVGKLVRDGLRFEETSGETATELRRELFTQAAAARRGAGPAPFDRAAFLESFARARGTTAPALEAALYADRPGAQRLLAVEVPAPTLVAAGFGISEAQAVLLRATKIVAEVEAGDAALYRRLFRTLKFLRLLPVITRLEKRGGYRVEMDGPLSLFQGGGRYGLSLALALPAIAACDRWRLEADVRWGAERRPLRFRLAGEEPSVAVAGPGDAPPGDALPDELATFVTAFARVTTDWKIDRAPAILDLPGVGLCVPDLCFVRNADGARVHFELLGFWSREAVFRRIDLVRAGLPQRILFAASKSLRVGEALLDDAQTAALYVFSRVLNVRTILDHLERIAPAL
jgi:predicted nuclease of restriction endonuclease-like RecB superfamily